MKELGDGLPSWNLKSFVGQFSFGRRSSMPNDSHRRSHPCFHLGAWFYAKSWNLVGVLFETQEIYGDIFQGQADGETVFFFLRDTKRWRVEENSIIMPDVPNFAKQHFEHFQRSNGHRSTGETLLYQAGSSLGPFSGHQNRRLNVEYPRSFNRETTHQQRTMIWSTLRPSWSLFHKLRCRKVPMSFLSKAFFHVFPLWGLGLVPDSMSWDSAYCATFAAWALTDGWWVVVLVRCGIAVPALCSR